MNQNTKDKEKSSQTKGNSDTRLNTIDEISSTDDYCIRIRPRERPMTKKRTKIQCNKTTTYIDH